MHCVTVVSLSFSHAVSVAVLSSAVLSIIGTALITSLVWCCAVKKKKDINTDLSNIPLSTQPETMLTPFQGNISLAYGQVGSRIRK